MNIEKHRAFLESLEGERGLPEVCDACGGDGKETCNNPDHGFHNSIGESDGCHGCPVCGNDPLHKVPNGGDCSICEGTGKISAKRLPEEIHNPSGWRFDMPIKDFLNTCDPSESKGRKLIGDYLLERLKRAESRQIPDLKEQVKELVRDAMDLTHDLIASRFATDATHEFYKAKYDAFRSLCAPDKGGEVKP